MGPPPAPERPKREAKIKARKAIDLSKGNSSKDLESLVLKENAARMILAGDVGAVLEVKLAVQGINDACREVGLDVMHKGAVHRKLEFLVQKGLSTIARAGTESDLEKRAESAESKCAALEKQLKGAHQSF